MKKKIRPTKSTVSIGNKKVMAGTVRGLESCTSCKDCEECYKEEDLTTRWHKLCIKMFGRIV